MREWEDTELWGAHVRRARSARRGTTFARGLALFFGAFSLANGAALLRGLPNSGDIWWIDLSLLPAWLSGAFGLGAAALLVAWALDPHARPRLRGLTFLSAAALAVAALANCVAFYSSWRAGSIAPAMPLPASLLYAAGLARVAFVVRRSGATAAAENGATRRDALAVAALVVVLAIAFPLVQVFFFGTTDYRRPSDAAVVLGAKAYANGTLSTSLEDRVRTGADLYRAGLVRLLVMSGAVGESGVDETVAMRDRAVALGVPASAILLDPAGLNTDATVRETIAIFEANGVRRVLAVSQFYHLPRIKLAYRAAGWDVQTVPATFSRYIPETPYLVAREIPAFWQYWARSVTGF